MRILGWSLTILVLASVFAAGVWPWLPPPRSPRIAFVQRNLAVFIPTLALLLVWGIAIGTRLATGEWPVPCRMLFPRTPTGEIEVVFVGSPPDGMWGILRFFAQLLLAATFAIAASTPVRMTIKALSARMDDSRFSWRRNLLILMCAALIFASYATTPGRSALEWIID